MVGQIQNIQRRQSERGILHPPVQPQPFLPSIMMIFSCSLLVEIIYKKKISIWERGSWWSQSLWTKEWEYEREVHLFWIMSISLFRCNIYLLGLFGFNPIKWNYFFFFFLNFLQICHIRLICSLFPTVFLFTLILCLTMTILYNKHYNVTLGQQHR